jgi:hypothetical protein
MNRKKNTQGFSLMHVVVSLAVFLVFSFGIIATLHLLLKLVGISKTQTALHHAVVNDLQAIQNLVYEDIGIIESIPSGVLEKTRTITIDNTDITLTRTVRFVDDPIDGTLSGNPQDLAPADYKHIIVEATCSTCSTQFIETAGIYMYAENDISAQGTGSLAVNVANTRGEPLSNATVEIQSLTINPSVHITDTTNSSGELHILQLPTGVEEYSVTITKNGHTTTQTLSSSQENPNPVDPPITIAEYQTTQKTFVIDKPATIVAHLKDAQCAPVTNAQVTFTGEQLVGNTPDILLFSENVVSDAQGNATLTQILPETISTKITTHDIVGSIPPIPNTLTAGMTEHLTLFLGDPTDHSLLVTIVDAETGESVPNAQLALTLGAATHNGTTHGQAITQTTWSGGPNQLLFTNPTEYWSQTGSINTQIVDSISLKQPGTQFLPQGTLESSIIDLGNQQTALSRIILTPTIQELGLGSDSVRVQIATDSTTTTPQWNYLGPDDTQNSYYTTTQAITPSQSNRYARYKITLSTPSSTMTPHITHIGLEHSTVCGAPGQAYFGDLSNDTYSLTVTAENFDPITTDIPILQDTYYHITLIPS